MAGRDGVYDILAPNDKEDENSLEAKKKASKNYNEEGKKRCCCCGKWMDVSQFAKHKSQWDGLQMFCRDCSKFHVYESRYKTNDDGDLCSKFQNARQVMRSIAVVMKDRSQHGWYD